MPNKFQYQCHPPHNKTISQQGKKKHREETRQKIKGRVHDSEHENSHLVGHFYQNELHIASALRSQRKVPELQREVSTDRYMKFVIESA